MRLIKQAALSLSVILVLPLIVATAEASPPSGFRTLSASDFRPIAPVAVDRSGPTSTPVPSQTLPIIRDRLSTMPPPPSLPPREQPRVTAQVAPPVNKAPAVASATGRSARGKASWYCKAGVSVCHYKYPAGSMVAAACGKLRAAMGSSWRGKVVTVTGNGRTVTVKLVDWCGSTTKLIDLYWEPMRRLGGTGVLSVRVSW